MILWGVSDVCVVNRFNGGVFCCLVRISDLLQTSKQCAGRFNKNVQKFTNVNEFIVGFRLHIEEV